VGTGHRQHPTLDQRLVAAAWLADRGWDRARETIELANESTAESRIAALKRLTKSERETLRTILTRALDEPPPGDDAALSGWARFQTRTWYCTR
jgi:hypothetical protein